MLKSKASSGPFGPIVQADRETAATATQAFRRENRFMTASPLLHDVADRVFGRVARRPLSGILAVDRIEVSAQDRLRICRHDEPVIRTGELSLGNRIDEIG